MQDVIIDLSTLEFFQVFWFGILACKEGVPECCDVVELLDHRDHVANSAQISDSNEFLQGHRSALWRLADSRLFGIFDSIQ